MTNRAANQGRSSEPVTWACCGEMQSVRPQGFVWFRLQHNTSLAHQRGNISPWGMQQERAQRGRWWISDPKFVNAWAIPGIISDAEVADAFFPRSKHSVAFFPIKPLQGWSAHPRLGFAHGQHLRSSDITATPWEDFQLCSEALPSPGELPKLSVEQLLLFYFFLMPLTAVPCQLAGGATCPWTHIVELPAPWEVPGASLQQEFAAPEHSRAGSVSCEPFWQDGPTATGSLNFWLLQGEDCFSKLC